ncbi:hypothetical protein H072_2164 [Dactylellina haptotyla CBS 200.50]|uniref:DNA polymerase kappa n=1 Tax=Dactylellina haptotyla (strain CBS 200.50) TaxID=1284197 RepID=S8ALS5_DACHA|nr:hypothetical protein H072_2164 [Dactylellina haptotyla CBS 200.50]
MAHRDDLPFVQDLRPLSKEQLAASIARQRGRKPTFAKPPPPPAAVSSTTTTPADDKQDENAPPGSSQSTLKKQLLGPSLLKSGQDNVDQSKVAEIIYEASKGSKYFINESRKDVELTKRIDRILKKKAALEKQDTSKDFKKTDELIAALELDRDLSQIVVHVDCDAFYASVEELDHPEFKKVPMAVGKGVLTTCNYEARKFGCRSGMAGHIALKLCPQLIFLPLNFTKYNAKAKEVREILARYDPRFEAASCDEAYLNITKYLEKHNMGAEEAVEQMRKEVFEHAKITVSAGIAPNARIAKICSNKNKPNGQFSILGDRSAVVAFMRALPVRKVNGIGRVFERELEAVGIKTLGDIYPVRGLLLKLFGQKAYEFLMSAFLGLGRTEIRPAEEYIRKSIGSESTFRDCEGTNNLRERLRKTAEDLEADLVKTELQGRTLALKIKLYTYEEAIRQKPLPYPIWKASDLYDYALPLLTKLEEEYKPMKLRLMGLRLTNISTRKKGAAGGNNFFKPIVIKKRKFGEEEEEEKWEEWPEEEFQKYDETGFQIPQEEEDIERDEEEMMYFDGLKSDDFLAVEGEGVEAVLETVKSEEEKKEEEVYWPCPICNQPQMPDDRTFNDHVDYCLSKQTIREAVRLGDEENEEGRVTPVPTRAEASASPEKSTINAIFKEYRQSGNQKNPLPSKRGRPKGKRRKT